MVSSGLLRKSKGIYCLSHISPQCIIVLFQYIFCICINESFLSFLYDFVALGFTFFVMIVLKNNFIFLFY